MPSDKMCCDCAHAALRWSDEPCASCCLGVSGLVTDRLYWRPKASEPCEAPAVPVRVAILHEGADLTFGSRDEEYGDPAINMGCAGELKRVIRSHITREISAAEQEALDMVLTKISRYVTGTPKRDTFVDGATYFAILGELATRNSS